MGAWRSAAFYTVMRIFIFVFFFFGFVLINKWVFDSSGWLWPLIAAAVVSVAVSYLLLAGPRAEMAAGIERSMAERHARADAERVEEDLEDEGVATDGTPRP